MSTFEVKQNITLNWWGTPVYIYHFKLSNLEQECLVLIFFLIF